MRPVAEIERAQGRSGVRSVDRGVDQRSAAGRPARARLVRRGSASPRRPHRRRHRRRRVRRASSTSTSAVSADPGGFPTAVFAGLGEEPVSDELAAELQEVLDASAGGDGLTATLITPEGTWSGATGFAAGDRAMSPDDQMSIASITKTLVAAQVMQLVEAGELGLDDLVADRLPPDLEFDTNGARIVDLLSMRSGYPETLDDEATWESLWTDPLHAWTTDEVLATVAPERAPGRSDVRVPGHQLRAARLDRRTRHRSAARRGAAWRGPRRRRVRAPDLSARRAADRADGDAVRCLGRHVRRPRRIPPDARRRDRRQRRGRHGLGLTEPRPMVQETVRRPGRLGCVARRDDRLRQAT